MFVTRDQESRHWWWYWPSEVPPGRVRAPELPGNLDGAKTHPHLCLCPDQGPLEDMVGD